jgi:hypothetical protein
MKIRTTRSITFVTEVPLNEDTYPGMSLAEAREYEEGLDLEEVIDELIACDATTMTASATIVDE